MRPLLLIVLAVMLTAMDRAHTSNNSIKSVPFEIKNIRSLKGNFVLCFFKSEESYNEGKECLRFEVSKDQVVNGVLQFDLKLPVGQYGVVVLDDENLNDQMDFGLFLPLEGFGFSNHFPMFRKPYFDEIVFPVVDSNAPITLKLRYM